MNGQLDAQRKEREADQQKLASNKAKIGADLQITRSDKEKTEKDLASKVEEVARLEDTVQQDRIQAEGYREAIESVKSTTSRAAKESQQKIEHLEKEKTTTDSKLSELSHALTASREQLTAERQIRTDAEASNEMFADKLEEAKKLFKQEAAKVKEAEERCSRALDKQEELRKHSEHQNAEASVQSLQQSVQISALEQCVQDQERECDQLNEEIEGLRTRSEDLDEALTQEKSKAKKAESGRAAALKEAADLYVQNGFLQKTLVDDVKSIEALGAKCERLADEVTELEKQRAECAAREAEVLAIFARTAYVHRETPKSMNAMKDATTDKSESTNSQEKIDEASTPASTSATHALAGLPTASQGASQQKEQSGNKRPLNPDTAGFDSRKRRRFNQDSPPPWARRASRDGTGEYF